MTDQQLASTSAKSNDRAGTRVERLTGNLAAARKTQAQYGGSDVFRLGDPMEQVL